MLAVQDLREKILRARDAAKTGKNEAAIGLATEVIETRPNALTAYLIRSDCYYAIGEQKLGMADLIAALSLPSAPRPIIDRVEKTFLSRLLRALDNDRAQLAIAANASVAELTAPRAAAAVKILVFVLNGKPDEAMQFVDSLEENARSLFSTRLAARLMLYNERLDAAAEQYRLFAAIDVAQIVRDPEFLAVLEYRRAQALRLRDDSLIAPRYRIAICASLKDEADDLEEWIAYHAAIGVEAFYLYDNASTDATPQILSKLAQRYCIHHRSVPHQPGQLLAFQHFIEFHRLDAEWAAFVDGDEFINPARTGDLQAVLKRNAANAAIAMNWANFGSSGHLSKPEKLCIEAYTRRAPDEDSGNLMIKGIVRPHRVVRYLNPHCMVVFGRYGDGLGRPVYPVAQRLAPVCFDAIQVNHYAVKSREQAERKLKRGNPVHESSPHKYRTRAYLEKFDRNDVEDISILKFAPAVRSALGELGTVS